MVSVGAVRRRHCAPWGRNGLRPLPGRPGQPVQRLDDPVDRFELVLRR
jgi:hypothetical protein